MSLKKLQLHNLHLRLGNVLYANNSSVTIEDFRAGQSSILSNNIGGRQKGHTAFRDYDQQIGEVNCVARENKETAFQLPKGRLEDYNNTTVIRRNSSLRACSKAVISPFPSNASEQFIHEPMSPE